MKTLKVFKIIRIESESLKRYERGMMFGVHLTLTPDKLSEVVQLRKLGKIMCPKGVKIIEEYIWSLKFLVVIVESDNLGKVMDFAKQFSRYAADLEVGAVTTLKDLASM